MKKYIIRIISMILLIWTFILIFGFSSQDGEASSSVSNKVATFVVDILLNNNSLIEKQQQIENITPIIRKIAHFTIYTFAGIFIITFIHTYNLQEREQITISAIIGVLYAFSDEIHQAFIPGRAAQITDVCLDSMGVLLGIFIVLLIIKLWELKEALMHPQIYT